MSVRMSPDEQARPLSAFPARQTLVKASTLRRSDSPVRRNSPLQWIPPTNGGKGPFTPVLDAQVNARLVRGPDISRKTNEWPLPGQNLRFVTNLSPARDSTFLHEDAPDSTCQTPVDAVVRTSVSWAPVQSPAFRELAAQNYLAHGMQEVRGSTPLGSTDHLGKQMRIHHFGVVARQTAHQTVRCLGRGGYWSDR